jgi:hypothetical protein
LGFLEATGLPTALTVKALSGIETGIAGNIWKATLLLLGPVENGLLSPEFNLTDAANYIRR